jgi:predicted Zn-dependent protease
MNTTAITTTTFDYGTIEDKEAKGKLINLEGRIKKHHAGMAESIVDIGRELATAQAVLSNHHDGVFVKWVEGACGLSRTTAYRYLNVFTRFGDSFPTVGKLEDTALYVLAEPKTPKKAVDEARKMADRGVAVTAKIAKELIAKHKPKPPEPERAPQPEQQPISEAIASVREDEDEPLEEMSVQEKCDADNRDIESFCRVLMAFFDDHVPDTVWIDSQGRVNSARSSIKAGCNTLRQSKSVLCPKCDEGRVRSGECGACKGYGYLPKIMADALGGK